MTGGPRFPGGPAAEGGAPDGEPGGAAQRGADPDASEREVLVGEGLRVRYGGAAAVSVERIALRRGELLVLLGPNGAGKSTLMRALALLEPPDAGQVTYRGRSGREAATALRADSAAVFQRPHLWSGGVEYNLRLALRLRGVRGEAASRRVERAAGALGVDELRGREVDGLSGGELRRVALARALAADPAVLFLDEPTADLDQESREALRRDLDRVTRVEGRSTLLITHDRREAFRLADRIAVMSGGRVVQVGTPSQLYEDPGDPYVARVTGAELALDGTVAAREGSLLTVDVGGGILRAVGAGQPGERVRLSYRPEDLAVSRSRGPAAAARDSVRNSLPATVRQVREVAGLVRVRLEGPPELVAVITRGSAEELELRPGVPVRVRVKASALRCFPG